MGVCGDRGGHFGYRGAEKNGAAVQGSRRGPLYARN